jgi:hypothetical protein
MENDPTIEEALSYVTGAKPPPPPQKSPPVYSPIPPAPLLPAPPPPPPPPPPTQPAPQEYHVQHFQDHPHAPPPTPTPEPSPAPPPPPARPAAYDELQIAAVCAAAYIALQLAPPASSSSRWVATFVSGRTTDVLIKAAIMGLVAWFACTQL